jgi:SAM-dependent methyltransferase
MTPKSEDGSGGKLSYKQHFSWLDRETGLKILDFGSGWGTFGRRYGRRHMVFGLDIEIKKGVEYKSSSLVLADGNACLPFASEVFDVVHFSHTLEHLHKKDLAVAEVYRVLKPRGLLLLSVPNEKSLQTLPFHFLRKLAPVQGVAAIGVEPAHRKLGWKNLLLYLNYFCWNDPYHMGEFNKNSIQVLINRHGFSIDSIEMEEVAFLSDLLAVQSVQALGG